METETEDILVPIPDEDLPELAKIYHGYMDSIPHIFGAINTVIKFKKYEQIRNLINIYSPNNSWKNDGTFIILMEFGCYDLIIFTLDDNCQALLDGLTKTKRINFQQNCLFYCLHYDHHSIILELIKIKQLKILFYMPCDMYSIKREKAFNFNLQCPPRVYVKNLEKSDALVINSLSPHRYPGSDIFLTNLIEFNGGYGLYLNGSNELVSWILRTPMGKLGILETVSGHRRKGYGSFLLKCMSRIIAEEGHNPLATVVIDNLPSQAMFRKLGFQSLGFYTFVGVAPLS